MNTESLRRQQIELTKAKKAFQKLLQQEKNEIRFQKLKEYNRLVDQALTADEVKLLQRQAISDADKEYAVLQMQQQTVKKENIRRKLEIIVWMIGLVACAILYLTGFEDVYYYRMPDGTMLETTQYEGKSVFVSESKVTVVYSHKDRLFQQDDYVRIVFMVLIIAFCIMSSILAEKEF